MTKTEKTLLIIAGSLAIGLCITGAVIVSYNRSNDKLSNDINVLSSQMQKEHGDKLSVIYTRDSLYKIDVLLSKYRGLTDAMGFRDSIRIPLKHRVGDIVYMKVDSSKAVIADIITGGGKYDFYMKYKIVRQNCTEEIIPELIY